MPKASKVAVPFNEKPKEPELRLQVKVERFKVPVLIVTAPFGLAFAASVNELAVAVLIVSAPSAVATVGNSGPVVMFAALLYTKLTTPP